MKDELVNQLMAEVIKKIDGSEKAENSPQPVTNCNLTEFVGTALGDTIGFVIANVDAQLHEAMKLDPKYKSIGILSARVGAGPHVFAADEAVKATNTEVVLCEFARDTKGGAGHGSLTVFGAEDVSDAKRAVEVALNDLGRTFGDVYGNDAGHLEFQYTARASFACNKVLGAPIGKAFGIIVGAPAGIGVLMADAALKAANVELVGFASPDNGGTKYSNEAMVFITGDAGAVRQAIYAARDVGLPSLSAMAGPAASMSNPYI